MNQIEKTQLLNELRNLFGTVGDNEFELAMRNAETNGTKVEEEFRQHREKHERGRTNNIGAAAYASSDVWLQIQEESEADAKQILLGPSAMHAELTDLQRRAAQAKALVDQKDREIQELWSQYQALPAKVEAANEKLAAIERELTILDPATLSETFKSAYKAILTGVSNDALSLVFAGTMITTRNLRVEVLDGMAADLTAELAEYTARRKSLAKRLGLPKAN